MIRRAPSAHIHPAEILHFLWRYAFLLLIPLVRQLAVSQGSAWERLSAALSNLVMTLLVVAAAVVRWYTVRFSAGRGMIHYAAGVLRQERRQIPVRAVDCLVQRAGPIALLCGAARVSLETSAGSRRKADVQVLLTRKKAHRLFVLLAGDHRKTQYYAPSVWRVAAMAASWSNGFSGLLIAAPFIQKTGQILGEEASRLLYDTVDFRLQLVSLGLPPVAAGLAWVLFGGWLFALLNQWMRYWRFCGWRQGAFLASRSGVFHSRRRLFRVSRIRAVTARQTLLMSWAGLSTAYAHIAGDRKDKNPNAVVAVSMARAPLLRQLRATLGYAPKGAKIKPPPRAASGYLTPVLLPVAAVSLLAVLLNGTGAPVALPFLSLPVIAILVWRALVRMQALGSAYFQPGEQFVTVSRDRGFSLLTTVIPKQNVTMVRLSQTVFQKRSGLCHVRLSVYGERPLHCTVRHLDYQKVRKACERYGLLPSQEGRPV